MKTISYIGDHFKNFNRKGNQKKNRKCNNILSKSELNRTLMNAFTVKMFSVLLIKFHTFGAKMF